MASAYCSAFDCKSPIFRRIRASFGSSWMTFWNSAIALSYFFFSTYFWAASSTFSRLIATDEGTPDHRASHDRDAAGDPVTAGKGSARCYPGGDTSRIALLALGCILPLQG